MIPRERILTTLRRGVPDRVPFELSFTPVLRKTFEEKTGSRDVADYFDFDCRGIGISPTRKRVDFAKYFREIPEGATISEWGWMEVPGSLEHFKHHVSPLKEASTIKDIEDYPLPDIDADYRYEGLAKKVTEIKEKGYAVMACFGFSTFDYSWLIRGIDQFMMDLLLAPEMAECLMNRINDIMTSATGKYVAAGVDIIGWGEDIGGQHNMIMSPDTWRRFIKPCFARMIRKAKEVNPDVIVFYHSDGWFEPVIPDLIEIGVEILNPVQPECMDPAKIKMKYGERLAFWGTIGTQTTMPFGTPEEVREEVKLRIQIVGKGGGLVIAPSHTLEPEVPWENVEAFVEAVKEYGKY